MPFNKVVIRNKTQQEHNIHLAVHPFPYDDGIVSISNTGRGMFKINNEPLSEWQKSLVLELYEKIPGLQMVFLKNGEITLQHAGLFDDEEIIEEATKIITPYLEQNLLLMSLED